MNKYSFIKKRSAASEYAIFALFLILAGVLATKNYAYAVTDGIKLWAATLLPALFPYFFITSVLSSLSVTGKLSVKLSPVTKKLFHTGGITGYAFFLSTLSGYPVGAKTVAELKKQGLITETEAVRAAAFCSTPSPMFLISGVGALTFCDGRFGVCLFLCNLSAAIITGFIFSFYKRKDEPSKKAAIFNKANFSLYDGVYSSVVSVLVVGGVVALFTVFIAVLSDTGAFIPLNAIIGIFTDDERTIKGVSIGILECTNGIKILSAAQKNFFTLPTVAAICGFGGICVLLQSFIHLKSAKIKIAPFIFAKIIHAILSFIIGILFSLFIR